MSSTVLSKYLNIKIGKAIISLKRYKNLSVILKEEQGLEVKLDVPKGVKMSLLVFRVVRSCGIVGRY
jgi:hypothetical protein